MNFLFELVTPEKKVYSGEVEMIIAKAIDGDIGILANHTPIVTPLDIDQLCIKQDGKKEYLAVGGGILEVSKDKVLVLAESAETPEEIDLQRAKEAKERAEKRLEDPDPDTNLTKAEIALKKAINRIEVAEKDS
ncbi:F0F1 ATP synthase subunit epsilon [Proteinivorax hydrogeniformans]|uniref:ATP synthase epsilon chain n=1 Tax=Proteinivorax hydrogeniformans TaxID=1826727 RepID=A0AAU8HSP4_9FIRM